IEWPVDHLNPRLRTEIDIAIARTVAGHYPVVQKENLALPLQLAIDRIANTPLVVGGHHGLHWQTVKWRGLNRRHVFYAHQRKVERARDWRCGKRQDINKFK